MSSKDSSEIWEMDSNLEAKEVFVVMQNNYRISRNIRAQWFFKNLNKTLTFKWKTGQEQCSEEIEIISAIPKLTEKFDVDPEQNTSVIKIVSDTKIHFLSTQYRLVFCLDLSSSVSTVDLQHDNIFFEEIFISLEKSLKSISQPFFVPGSEYYFSPQIYITVIAHIPNCSSSTPQAIIQGWILTPSNVDTLLEYLQSKLEYMCKLVKTASSTVHEEQIHFMMSHDAAGSMIDSTIEGNKMIKKVLDLSADISTLKVIRYGILALQLLPENSSAGIVVITDGILNFPTCKSLDALLTQLRNNTIACSFIQLGSSFHSFSCFGRVPYKELMEFIATATCGAYFSSCKYMVISESNRNLITPFHKSLLLWSFQKTSTSGFLEAYEPSSDRENYWHVDNPHFYTVAHQSRVKKKHTEGTWKVSLENILSCRLREGYSVKSVLIDEAKSTTEIRLVLPWMLSTNIEYLITSGPNPGRQWKSSYSDLNCHFEIIVDGCYEFLHDVTCSDKKPIRSVYRKTVITQFWSYIKNLSNTDQILTQLHSFALNPLYYTIPESIKNGVPLFYFSTNSSMPILQSTNVTNIQFTSFWKPLCMLDINVWQKWMHAHRIGVILQHDTPLQKNLHLPNSSGRYAHVQCRLAITALNSLLSEESSFVLVENHSYINLLFDDPDKPPVSFYVIRVTSKPPCVVIRLAFLGGLPGRQRHQIVNNLREKILRLKLSKPSSVKDYPRSCQSFPSESCCCFILRKPVEKILIRYEKLPTNFLISIPDSQGNTRNIPIHQKHSDSYFFADALATLSKYLLQQRWIWTLQYESCTSLDLKSASKILYTLTKIRLQEGFHFSHSSFGIVYMVQEIPVEVPKEKLSSSGSIVEKERNCCVVQYIIFPPHTNTTVKDSISEEDDTELTEADGELQLITECWIEPQYGVTVMPSELEYLNGLKYEEIPLALHQKDLEVMRVLTTFEHLCCVCQKSPTSQSIPFQSYEEDNGQPHYAVPATPLPNISVLPKNEQIDQTNAIIVPYAFSLMSLLPKCPQTEMMFSTLHEIQHNGKEGEISGNTTFFDFLMENIEHFHDQEITLTATDCAVYLFQIFHRGHSVTSNPSVPFPHPKFTASGLFIWQSSSIDLSKCEFCSKLSAPSKSEDFSQETLPDHIKNCIPKWRCFVKSCASSHVILTLIPATYEDLKKLYFPPDPNVSEKTSQDKTKAPHIEDYEENSDTSESSTVGNENTCHEKENVTDISNMNALILPIYVYNCISSSIINRLVQTHNCNTIIDTSENHVFDCDCHLTETSKHTNEVNGEDEVKKTIDAIVLKEHCSLIEKAFSKAFVYGVYRSLMSDFSIQKSDAVAAIDNICEESLLEINITEFIFMICGHVKDFFTKRSVKQMHLSQESTEDDQAIKAHYQSSEQDKAADKSYFPLSMLQKYQPCEELYQKHLNVKEKFSEIIKSFFKVIPSRSDYFFFCPAADDIEDISLLNDGLESQEEDVLSESIVFEESESVKFNNGVEEDAGSKSCFNTNSTVSSIDKDTEPSSVQDKSTLYPPLIVHFSCSVRGSNQEMKSCPLVLLPTCLNDIIKCLDTDSNEISLEDLKITLDMYCLTVPADIESPEIPRRQTYSTSFSSNSPVPEADIYHKQYVKDYDNESNCSDIPTDTLQGGSLVNLPQFQSEAVFRCIDKVKWLLQDEKVSVALNCFPITSDALDMVIDHVKSSKDKPCCIIKEIPLTFVYGSENSLDKFTQAFKRMSPIGYRLEEVNGCYYLTIDTDSEQKPSFETTLGIAQFNILKGIPHSDDGTELKRIVEEIKDTPVFPDIDFSVSQDRRGSEIENEVFSLIRDKKFQLLQPDDDSETEDGTEDCRPKAKFKKSSIKKIGCIHTCKRQINSSLWETERKKDKSSNVSKCSSCKQASADSETNKKDQTLAEGEENSECQTNTAVEESSPDASLEIKSQNQASNLFLSGRLKTSDSDDPTADKDTEYRKFLCSNTEDGYDGDSSDSGSDFDFINSLDTRRPVLPRFWLIMNICEEEVIIYFHMRNCAEDDPELIHCKTVLDEVATIVAKICKEVNQILLLKSLWDVRMCDRLLVPEENEDLWKGSDPNRTISSDDPDYILEVQEKCLAATLKFDPGTFGCPIVWVTHFRLHHRLAVSSTGSHKSCGMQALRSVLNTFSVNNRENMFVYQESSGRVFYIRLFEEYCDVDHQRNGDDISLVDRYSSMQSLPTRGAVNDCEIDLEFRPRVNSGASDSYRQDSISTSSTSRKHLKCVAMYVHGIGEVGTDIKKDLVQVLQNRLNEGVLDQINMMFCRNPQCMLTPEDVQFIQNTNNPPAHELFFTLPVKLLGYAHAIHIYLRQNLLHFLYTPKYTDSKKETHFKVYWDDSQEWSQTDDNDIFIYHPQQTLGRPGGKGITCVILSLITGQRKPFQTLEFLPPNPFAYQDGLFESEYVDLTATSFYNAKNERTPGPVALVRFQLWHVGKDNVEYLEVQLKNAIHHALWDLLLEYRALTSPTSEASYLDDSSCYSEPTTPIRMRRSGLVNMESSLQMKDLHSSIKLHSTKEMSSSVPDIATKAHSSSPLLKDISAFNFGNKPQSAKPEFSSQASHPSSQLTVPSSSSSKSEKRNLNVMFHSSMKPFLEFGDKLGCSNLAKNVQLLPSRHSVNFILKEVIKVIKYFLRDLTPKVYIKIADSLAGDVEFVPYDLIERNANLNEESRPSSTRELIMMGRNEKQWRSYMGLDDFMKFHEISSEGVKSYQKHLTHMCDHQNIEIYPESIPSSPTFINKSNTSFTSSSPNLKTARSMDTQSSTSPVFVPRQRLFLLYVEDKKMTVYLYNWAQDLTQNVMESITRLNKWHHHRNSLLNNIILQKLGLFQGLEVLHRSDEKSSKESKSSVLKGTVDEPVQSTLGYVEQLVRYHAFISSKESSNLINSSSKSSSANLRSNYIVKSLKNIRPRTPFHLSPSTNIKDPVMAHGAHYLEAIAPQRRDMQLLYNMWQTRGSNVNYPFDRVFSELKRQARLSHYCLTPLLFSPPWRYKVAPIRDHGLEPLDQLVNSIERLPEIAVSGRSRHSSGSSLKTSDFSTSSSSTSRTRRMSGAAGYPGSNQGSPKMRTKTPSEETWHTTVCHHYLQEYIQYLHTVGFVSLQTSETSDKRFSIASDDDRLSRSDSFSRHRNSTRGSPNYLIKCMLGGLLVFELGLNDPYAFGHLYSLECLRFSACSSRTLSSQFTAAFLDELDKVKMNINLHSFTYDYHLRTIHSYISGRQLIFRHGYHLTSFLDDFIKYYQKVPTGARNLVFSGTLTVSDINMSGDQLYNYIISHNKLYGMTVLRMVPIISDSNLSIDTEFALIELSAQKASYKDVNDVCQMGSFDVGILINQNTTDVAIEPNSLILNFYIILTSQRDLYPKLSNFGTTLGSFQPVRYGSALSSSGFSSRKTSTVSIVTERDKFESSGEESIHSSDSGSRSKKISFIRGMCDEDVMYLGYYSSQETMMQQVLSQQAESARIHLKEVVQQASIHCRRDFLWSSLLPRTLKEENSSKDHSLSSYVEFAELLELVPNLPMGAIDSKLEPLKNMHISWYTTLAPVLKAKYADSHREFISPDNSSLYVVVTNNKCPDSFMLLTIDTQTNRAELCLVIREQSSSLLEQVGDRIILRSPTLILLLEEFVNTCCFHLWTCLLPG
ncbi:KICSTOR complex protein SZT2 [Trichonephila clavata]|uniref:KICSTOR complex protein SZT2 n=1 Tax=Trichonephila clavata TaxID=2740835 RepID=A0A8X6GVN6_TRICU|nr:KICSTOR complex protein SZT2 [Trichonephila clavata]